MGFCDELLYLQTLSSGFVLSVSVPSTTHVRPSAGLLPGLQSLGFPLHWHRCMLCTHIHSGLPWSLTSHTLTLPPRDYSAHYHAIHPRPRPGLDPTNEGRWSKMGAASGIKRVIAKNIVSFVNLMKWLDLFSILQKCCWPLDQCNIFRF